MTRFGSKHESKVQGRPNRRRWVISISGENARVFIDGSGQLVPLSNSSQPLPSAN